MISNNFNLNNNLNNINVENNRPLHMSHSYITQRRNNIFDISNLNSEIYNDNNDDISENNNNNAVNYENHIDEIFDQLAYAISTEKQNLKNEKTNFRKDKFKFNDLKKQEIAKLEKKKELWKESIKIVESMNFKESDILDLDIGGTQKITTTRGTLLKVN